LYEASSLLKGKIPEGEEMNRLRRLARLDWSCFDHTHRSPWEFVSQAPDRSGENAEEGPDYRQTIKDEIRRLPFRMEE